MEYGLILQGLLYSRETGNDSMGVEKKATQNEANPVLSYQNTPDWQHHSRNSEINFNRGQL